MDSLNRKVALRRQAQDAAAAVARAEALARATQVAHSTVAVGDDDVPVIETLEEAVSVPGDLVVVAEGSEQAESDAFDAIINAGESAGDVADLKLRPAAVGAVAVTSNTGSWVNGEPRSVVGLSWPEVTESDDGSDIAISGYEIWSRFPAEVSRRDTSVSGTSVSIDSWVPGVERLVKVRARSASGVYGDFSDEVNVTPLMPLSVVPAAPGVPTLVSNVGAFTQTGARATVSFSWPAVSKSVEGADVSVDFYRVWLDGALHSEVESLTSSVNIASQVEGEIRVSAVANGLESDRSEPLVVTGAVPDLTPYTPSAPVLSSSHGSVRAVWDGLPAVPAGFLAVRVMARVSGGFRQQGSALDSGAERLVSVGEIGDTVEVELHAFDQLGRLMGVSNTASIVVAGVERADLDDAVNQFLTDLETQSGKAWDAASVAVKSYVDEYALSSSETVAPVSGWSTTAPLRTPGTFIWVRTTVTLGDDSTSVSSPVLVTGNAGAQGDPGAPGAPGAQGTSVSSVTPFYYLSASKPGKPTVLTPPSPWQPTEPQYNPSAKLWQTFRVLYSNSSFSYTDVSEVASYAASVLADGKLTLANTDPTVAQGTGKSVGSLWMRKTAGAFTTMFEWNGTQWVETPLAETIIPKVAIGEGTYGELEGDRLAARSVTAAKMLVGDLTNLWGNQYFKPDGPIVGTRYTGAETPPAGSAVLISVRDHHNAATAFEVRPGEEFLVSTTAKRIAGTLDLRGGLWRHDFDGGSGWAQLGDFTLVEEYDNGWGRYQRVVPIVEGTRTSGLYFQLNQNSPYGTQWLVSDVTIRRRGTAELLVDGTIGGRKLVVDEAFAEQFEGAAALFGKVTLDHLEPNIGDGISLEGNLTIRGITDPDNGALKQLQDGIDAVDTRADNQALLISQADSKAQAAASRIDDVAADLSSHKQQFSVVDGVPEIQTVDGEYKLRVEANRISMTHAGQETTYWSGNRFVVREIDIIQGFLANHWIESVGDYGTVVKPRREA